MVSSIERQILQSQMMERIQQVQQQHPDMQQHYFELQFGQDRRKLKKKVNESDHVYRTKVSEEEGNGQQQGHPKGQKETEQVVDGSASNEPKQQERIDIKV